MGVSSTSQKGWKITKVRKCNIWPSNRDFFSVVLPKSKKFQNVTFRAQFAKFSPRGYMRLPRGHPGYPQIGWKVTKVTKCNFWPIFFDFSPVVLPKSQKLVLPPPLAGSIADAFGSKIAIFKNRSFFGVLGSFSTQPKSGYFTESKAQSIIRRSFKNEKC